MDGGDLRRLNASQCESTGGVVLCASRNGGRAERQVLGNWRR